MNCIRELSDTQFNLEIGGSGRMITGECLTSPISPNSEISDKDSSLVALLITGHQAKQNLIAILMQFD
jgi:hypothetical protein